MNMKYTTYNWAAFLLLALNRIQYKLNIENRKFCLWYLPMQLVSPCSSKPDGQEHTKPPRVFVQKWLHGSCHRWHSSISKEKGNNAKHNKFV